LNYQSDIDKIIEFAKGLNVNIIFKDKSPEKTIALYYNKPPTIIIFKNKIKSRPDLILALLHELGHHLDYINTKKELHDAFLLEDQRTKKDPPLPKKLRKHIYKEEISGIKLMPKIAKQLKLDIEKWKVIREMKLDIWVYRYYYENGNFPTIRENNLKNKQLTNMLKNPKK